MFSKDPSFFSTLFVVAYIHLCNMENDKWEWDRQLILFISCSECRWAVSWWMLTLFKSTKYFFFFSFPKISVSKSSLSTLKNSSIYVLIICKGQLNYTSFLTAAYNILSYKRLGKDKPIIKVFLSLHPKNAWWKNNKMRYCFREWEWRNFERADLLE